MTPESPGGVVREVRVGLAAASAVEGRLPRGVLVVVRARLPLVVFAILLPTVDPVSLAFEVVPLVLLFELSIWLSVLMERRWQRAWDEELAGI